MHISYIRFFNKTTVQNRSHLPKQKANDSFSYLLPLNRSCWLPALHFVLPEYSSAAAPGAPAERRGSFFLCQELPALSASGSVSPSAGGAGSPALFGCYWVSCWSTAKRKFIRHYYSVVLIDTKQMFPKSWSGKETPHLFCITLRYWPGSWVFGFHLLCLWFDSAESFWLDGALPQGTAAPIGTKIKLV